MNACPLPYFNQSTHASNVRIGKTSFKNIDLLGNYIIELLSKQSSFLITNNDYSDDYKQSIIELADYTLKKIESDINDGKLSVNFLFDNACKEYIKQRIELHAFPMNLTPVELAIKDSLSDIDVITELKRKLTEYKDVVNEIFGSKQSAFNGHRIDKFLLRMILCTIIDRSTSKLITSVEEMNDAIIEYLNDLYSVIYKYLRSQGYELEKYEIPSSMFLNGELSEGYANIFTLMYNIIHKYKNDENLDNYIEDGFIQATLNSSNGELNFYLAASAYVTLVYFDDSIQDSFSGYITIKKNYDAPIVEIEDNFGDTKTDYKYGFSSGNSYSINSWTNLDRDAVSELGQFSRVLIRSIPIYEFDINDGKSVLLQSMMTQVDFINTITTLIELSSEIVGNNDIRNALLDIIKEPRKSLKTVLDLLFNQEGFTLLKSLRRNNGFDQNYINYLYSIYKTLFLDENSWDNIEHDYIMTHSMPTTYPIIDTLLGVVVSSVQNSFVESSVNIELGGTSVVETRVKPRYINRRAKYDMEARVNRSVVVGVDQLILNEYPIEYNKQELRHSITLGLQTESFTIDIIGTKGTDILQKSLITPKSLVVNGFPEVKASDFATKEQRDKLMSSDNLSERELQIMSIVTFVDDMLGTNFSKSTDGLIKLYYMLDASENNLKEMFLSAARARVVHGLYNDMLNETKPDGTKYSRSEMVEYLKDKKPYYIDINPATNKAKNYFKQQMAGTYLSIIDTKLKWLDDLSNVEAIISQSTSVSQINNFEGNKIPNYSPTYLGSRVRLQTHQASKENAATSNLLFVDDSGMIKVEGVDTDIQAPNGQRKNVKDCSIRELLFNSFVYKFVNPFLYSKDKVLYFLPTVASDKPKIPVYGISFEDIKAKLGINGIADPHLDEKVVDGIKNTVGKMYKDIRDAVINDFTKILGIDNATSQSIEKELNSLTEEELLLKVLLYNKLNNTNFVLYKETHYRVVDLNGKKVCTLNPLLFAYSDYIYDRNLYDRINEEKVQFVNLAMKNLVNFRIDTNPEGKYYSVYELMKLCCGEKKAKDWIDDGYLVLAKAKNKVTGAERSVLFGEVDPEVEEVELNPAVNAWFMISMYINTNLRLSITGSEINHPTKVTKMPNLNKIKDYKDLISQLNPDYKESHNMSFMHIYHALQNYDSMSKEDKKKYKSDDILKIRQLYLSGIKSDEIVAQNTLLKRNAIITGNMRPFLQLTINGIPPKMKVAVIDDVRANVFNFNGLEDLIEAHNGSALISPIWSILENKSLLDNEGGEIKKPILHQYDARYGTCTFFKFATFTLTNLLMRQSEGNAFTEENKSISLLNLFKKTHSLRWSQSGLNIDLINGCQYRDSDLNGIDFHDDILNGNRLFYLGIDDKYLIIGFGRENGIYYTIEQRASTEDNAIGAQIKIYHYFDDNSNHIRKDSLLSEEEIKEGNFHTIDSLYELHCAMGGIYSMSRDENGTLYYSESSNFAVANFVNMVAYKKDLNQSDSHSIDLTNYNLPLKTALIGMTINLSGLKEGAGNINKAESLYNDDELMYMEVGTEMYGKQQESDHESDRSELSEPTQVITALSKGGYYQKDVDLLYLSIGNLIIKMSNIELNAIEEFNSTGNKSKLYDIIGRTIIDNYNLGNNVSGLTEVIINNISKKFNLNITHEFDNLKIPFSDPNIYSKFLPTIMSVINRKTIKRKYSGAGAFLAPSYDMVTVYDIDGRIYLFEDLLKIAKNLGITSTEDDAYAYNRDIVKLYLELLQQKQEKMIGTGYINPTDNIIVSYTEIQQDNERGSIEITQKKIAHIRLDNISDYYSFKKDPNSFIKKKYNINSQILINYYSKDVVTPRNLAPTKVHYEYTDEYGDKHHMNIYDHWRVRNFFEEINKINSDNSTDKTTKKIKIQEARKKYNPQQAFVEINQGKYVDENGNEYKIYNLINSEAELIVSNMFASQFGVQAHKSLASVLQDGKINFKLLIPRINAVKYDMVFVASNNRHYYITFLQTENNDESTNSSYVSWKKIIRRPIKDKNGEVSVDKTSVIAIDSDNNLLFEVGQEILVNNVKYNKKTKKFTDLNNKVLDNQDKYRLSKDGKIFEYVEFVSRYRVKETMAGKKRNYYSNHMLYTINTENIKRTSIEEDSNSTIANILTKMYLCGDFGGITVNSELSELSCNILKDIMGNLVNNLKYNKNLSDCLGSIHELLYAGKKDNETGKIKLNSVLLNKIVVKHYRTIGEEKYSALQASLNFLASRIPAQTLLSFMSMKCVGFTGRSNAIAYVSHWQLWLLGSDFDIDKSYLLGCSLTDDGRYIGWSSLFDTTSISRLKASQTLPLPHGWTFKKSSSNEAVNIDDYIKQIVNAESITELIMGYSNLLNYLYLNNIKEVSFTHGEGDFVLSKLNDHESTKIPNDLISGAYKNYIQTNMRKISQGLLNLFEGHIPVEMYDLRDSAKGTAKGNDELLNSMLNPFTTFFMERINMEGKNTVGICANAAKASFMWHYYLNNVILNGNEQQKKMALFNFTSSRILGRKAGELKSILIETLSDIYFGNPNIKWDHFHLNPLVPVDNMISLMISAATDNAKELILSKINCGEKMAKMSLFLIVMGFNIDDVVSFMTSPVAQFINVITESDVCNNIDFSMSQALRLAKGEQIEGLPKHIANLIGKLRETLFKDMKKEDILADINEFKNVYDASNEFSSLGQVLGLNKGLPLTKQELQKYARRIEKILGDSLSRNANLLELSEKETIKNFDFLRFLTDSEYATNIKQIYDLVKICVNIFDVIDSIPHYKAMLRVLAGETIIDSSLSIKSKIYNAVYKNISSKYNSISDRFLLRMLGAIDLTFILMFLSQSGIKIPYESGTVLLNSNRTKTNAVENGFISFNSPEDIATFKYIFELAIIPNLQKSGTIVGYDSLGNMIDILIKDYKDNAFLLGLIMDFDGDRPIYKLDMDMMAVDRGQYNKIKFLQYLKGLLLLSNVYIDANKKTSVADLFFIYNLIVNKNRYGKTSLTKVFDILIKNKNSNSIAQKYEKFVGDLDSSGEVSSDDNWIHIKFGDQQHDVAINDILISSATTARSLLGQNDPATFVNTEDGKTLYLKQGYGYKKVNLLPKVYGESKEQQNDRMMVDTQYFVLGGTYAFSINRDIEMAQELDITLIRDLLGNGLITILRICK